MNDISLLFIIGFMALIVIHQIGNLKTRVTNLEKDVINDCNEEISVPKTERYRTMWGD